MTSLCICLIIELRIIASQCTTFRFPQICYWLLPCTASVPSFQFCNPYVTISYVIQVFARRTTWYTSSIFFFLSTPTTQLHDVDGTLTLMIQLRSQTKASLFPRDAHFPLSIKEHLFPTVEQYNIQSKRVWFKWPGIIQYYNFHAPNDKRKEDEIQDT